MRLDLASPRASRLTCDAGEQTVIPPHRPLVDAIRCPAISTIASMAHSCRMALAEGGPTLPATRIINVFESCRSARLALQMRNRTLVP